MSAAAQNAALAAMWAASDRRRIGWIIGHLREDVVHHDYRDHAALLPEGPAKEFYARYELARATAARGFFGAPVRQRPPHNRQSLILSTHTTSKVVWPRQTLLLDIGRIGLRFWYGPANCLT
jgi:hypothetical protein